MEEMNKAEESRAVSSEGTAAKKKISERSMTMTLFATLISIVLISALLVTTTWAWFTESVTTADNSISSAYCSVETVVSRDGIAVVGDVDGSFTSYSLEAGVEYTVTVTVTGSGRGGYLRLFFGSESRDPSYTDITTSDSYIAITPDDDTNVSSFAITLENAGKLIIESRWGNYRFDPADVLSGERYLYKDSTGELVKL